MPVFQDVRPLFIPATQSATLDDTISGTPMEFNVHHMDTHFWKSDLMMVYLTDPTIVENSIKTMEWLLAANDKYKVVDFDLAYIGGRADHDQKVAIAQFCVCHHVLLCHYCMSTNPCERFTSFVNSPD
ncbi:hypothetical protein D1007_14686 [Hordeum vulgare]|nr:hypothetical protein D1007_14686 [Hordeum vulgare]